jgi:hypothetical protein
MGLSCLAIYKVRVAHKATKVKLFFFGVHCGTWSVRLFDFFFFVYTVFIVHLGAILLLRKQADIEKLRVDVTRKYRRKN